MAEIGSLISQYGIPYDNPNNELQKSTDTSSSEQGAVRAAGAFSQHQFSVDYTITMFGFDFR